MSLTYLSVLVSPWDHRGGHASVVLNVPVPRELPPGKIHVTHSSKLKGVDRGNVDVEIEMVVHGKV
jgi:hypothetical protein